MSTAGETVHAHHEIDYIEIAGGDGIHGRR
jgi:hypothetical protein